MSDESVAGRMARIEELVRAVEASGDPDGRAAAQALCATLMELHEAGLRRILGVLSSSEGGAEIARTCAREEAVAAMLALHEIEVKPAARRPEEQLVQLRVPRQKEAAERCDLCGAALAAGHAHLLDPSSRQLACACPACSALFHEPRYVRVPRRVLRLDDFRMTDAQWDALGVPVRLAFFVRRAAPRGVVALYPSPAGAMESAVPPAAWQEIARLNPALEEMQCDVEALLVHRIGGAQDHIVAPIDRCFELTGALRSHKGSIVWWAPGDGGGQIRGFIDRLRQEAR
jgi:hypothetical protein